MIKKNKKSVVTDRFRERMLAYREDYSLAVREILHIIPTDQQEQLLKAFSKDSAHVSVRSGHGTGKTACLSWIILVTLALYPDCIIPCTAPSSHQLKDSLWGQLSLWHQQMDPFFGRELLILSDSVAIRGEEKTRFAVARTARKDKPEALQGFHAKHLVFVIDEASGIDEIIFQTAEGSLSTEGAKVVMTSNPTRTDGYFFESQTKERGKWDCLRFSCLDSPMVSKKYVRDMADKYGEGSSVYRVRVLGDFPESSDDVLIPIGWVEDAMGRDIIAPSKAQRVAGLDVARFGDDSTALAIRQGPVLTYLDEWRNMDLMETTGKVARMYRVDKKFDRVAVDAIGLGAGVADRLSEMGIPCTAVNVAETPSFDPQNYMRLRDELWFKARQWFESRSCRIDPEIRLRDDLLGELTSVRYSYTSNSKLKVESKKEMKERGLHSPNLADAFNLTFSEANTYIPSVFGGGMMSGVREVEVVDGQGWT